MGLKGILKNFVKTRDQLIKFKESNKAALNKKEEELSTLVEDQEKAEKVLDNINQILGE